MNNDPILQKLIDHEHRLIRIEEHMATKDDLRDFKDRILPTLDEMVVILRRLDQERHFTHARIDRMEEHVDRHEADLLEIKQSIKPS